MKEEINYVIKNVAHRKLRSGLSIISVMIGITAIFALLSFGFGIQKYIDSIASGAGVDKLLVEAKSIGAPGTDPNFFISKDDIDFIKKINGVSEIVGMYSKAGEIASRKQKRINFVSAFDAKYTRLIEETFSVSIDKGRSLKSGEIDKVVLGYNYQLNNNIFEKGLSTGDKITINDVPFTVVGFYSQVGNPQDDANIYMTKEGAENLYGDRIKDKFGFAIIRADKGVSTTLLAEQISTRLRKHKNEKEGEEDFFVQSFEDALKTFSNVVTIINAVLVMIAIISMIVAFVNIMSTMYTAVIERTKEIGIMKSIGARNNFIMFIFVLEAGLLGFIGGVAGVVLGYIFASIGGLIAASSGFSLLQPSFPIWLIIGCIAFATAVGAGSGYLPARHASRLKPVDAIRYE